MSKFIRVAVLVILGIIWLIPAYLVVVNAMKDLPSVTRKGGHLYVFSLNGPSK